jgi:DNA-binding response OmpR family regulator
MVDKSKTVLVIEDDESVRNLVVRALSELYTTYQAGDAKAALKLLESIRPPNLILCDVMMPGMSGTELVRQLKQADAFKNVPIIFLTAKTGPLDVIEGINAGARSYVTKPFQMKDLLERIAKAMR